MIESEDFIRSQAEEVFRSIRFIYESARISQREHHRHTEIYRFNPGRQTGKTSAIIRFVNEVNANTCIVLPTAAEKYIFMDVYKDTIPPGVGVYFMLQFPHSDSFDVVLLDNAAKTTLKEIEALHSKVAYKSLKHVGDPGGVFIAIG